MMRIIAGEFKGRHLVTVKGRQTRPILDRTKESLFGILADEVVDARVLDLFCGAGTLALESLSRGAQSAVLVDISRGAHTAAWKNISALRITDRLEFIRSDACRAIRKLAAEEAQFELIFVDPPYFGEFAQPVLAALREGHVLAQDGLVVFRHHKKESPADQAKGWEVVRQRKIGDAILTFLTLPADA
jgi:16S rRNA (guanine(966)-N(2))-methyltransferase RsmD